MSGEFRPKLCKECYEERDLKPTWSDRIEAGIALLGVCDVCLAYEACVEVTAQEALQLTRSDKKIIKAVIIGVCVALFIWLAFFVGTLRYRACRDAGVSVLNCVTRNFFRWREQTMKNKGLDVSTVIPAGLKVEYLTGDIAFKAQQVAAFTGIHPVILEMGRTLIEESGKVARFKLADAKMKEASEDIRGEFMNGLRRVGKALSKDPVVVKSGRDGDALVFWFAKSWSRKAAT
jgi:hypothetical protein